MAPIVRISPRENTVKGLLDVLLESHAVQVCLHYLSYMSRYLNEGSLGARDTWEREDCAHVFALSTYSEGYSRRTSVYH